MNIRLIIVLILLASLNLAKADESLEEVLVVTEHLAPYQIEMADGQGGGVAYRLVSRILEEAKIDASPRFFPWTRAYKLASRGRNVLIFSIGRSEQRETLFHWLTPLLITSPAELIYIKQYIDDDEEVDIRNARNCAIRENLFYEQMLAAGFVVGENLFEYQPIMINDNLKDDFVFFENRCDYYVAGWLDFYELALQMGIEAPEDVFGYKDAPSEIFGEDFALYLAASKDFDTDILDKLKDAINKLVSSNELFNLCISFKAIDKKDCRLLKP